MTHSKLAIGMIGGASALVLALSPSAALAHHGTTTTTGTTCSGRPHPEHAHRRPDQPRGPGRPAVGHLARRGPGPRQRPDGRPDRRPARSRSHAARPSNPVREPSTPSCTAVALSAARQRLPQSDVGPRRGDVQVPRPRSWSPETCDDAVVLIQPALGVDRARSRPPRLHRQRDGGTRRRRRLSHRAAEPPRAQEGARPFLGFSRRVPGSRTGGGRRTGGGCPGGLPSDGGAWTSSARNATSPVSAWPTS